MPLSVTDKNEMHPNDVEMQEDAHGTSREGSQDGVTLDKEAERRYVT